MHRVEMSNYEDIYIYIEIERDGLMFRKKFCRVFIKKNVKKGENKLKK